MGDQTAEPIPGLGHFPMYRISVRSLQFVFGIWSMTHSLFFGVYLCQTLTAVTNTTRSDQTLSDDQ